MEGNTFDLKFDNDLQTICEAVETSSTELVCLTNKFDTASDKDKTVGMNIIINGVTVTHSVSFKTKADVQLSVGLNPNSASPVLKTPIEISLDADFPYDLVKEDFSVNATSVDDSSYIRYLNVLSVDNEAKTIRAMFGGAYSGLFQMQIRHKYYGLVDTENMILDVSSEVTRVEPQ